MEVPVAFVLQLLAADDASALLLQPKFQPALIAVRLLYHLTLSAFFKVEFPLRVIRIGCAFDLAVSSDSCLVRLTQTHGADLACAVQGRAAEHLPSVHARVVLLCYPPGSLLPVSASRPAPQRLTDLPVHPPKRPPTRPVPVIV